MPTLEDYRRLAPFSLEELVSAANSILRDKPRLQVSKRTVRYYIGEGLLPPPTGSPKFARYDLGHLARLVAARRLLDRGLALLQVKEHLLEGFQTGLDPALAAAQIPGSPDSRQGLSVRESRSTYGCGSTTVTRIELTEDATLEIRTDADPLVALRRAAEALQDKLRTM